MSSSIRALLAHLCDVMSNCDELMALLDSTNGIRRMMGADPETPWVNVLTYGRVTRRRIQPRTPLYSLTVTFTPYVRGMAAAMTAGDYLLADIEEMLIQLFDIEQHKPDCIGPDHGEFLLMQSSFDDFSTEPVFNASYQGWTQSHRFRFDIVVPTCAPVEAVWCGQCP